VVGDPVVGPAVRPLTIRRLAAWAVLAGMAGIAVCATPWAGILFGVTAFVTFAGKTATLPPGPPGVIGRPETPGRRGADGLAVPTGPAG
jgi:hypothetical protein